LAKKMPGFNPLIFQKLELGQEHRKLQDAFSKVASVLPAGILADALSFAIRSQAPPGFESVAGKLYSLSERGVKIRFLNLLLFSGLAREQTDELLKSAGLPGFQQLVNSSGKAVTWNQGRQITSSMVGQLAAEAETATGRIVPAVSRIYAEHPNVITRVADPGLMLAVLQSVGKYPQSGRFLGAREGLEFALEGYTVPVMPIHQQSPGEQAGERIADPIGAGEEEPGGSGGPIGGGGEGLEFTLEGYTATEGVENVGSGGPPSGPALPLSASPQPEVAAGPAEARFVNFDFRELESGGESLKIHEGFRTKYTYEVAISIQPVPDKRFGDSQAGLDRPAEGEIVLDVVIFARNLDILSESYATLNWPARGPSTEAKFKVAAPAVPDESWIDVLLYHNHDVLFVATIHIEVRHEAEDWEPDSRPIKWDDIGVDQKNRLQVFKSISNLNQEFPRDASIAVVPSNKSNAYDLILYRKSAAYPIRVALSREELDDFAGRVRTVLDQIWRSPAFIDSGFDAKGKYVGEFLGEQGGFRSNGKRSVEVPAAFKDFLRTIAMIGNQLWDKLFGTQGGEILARQIESLDQGSTIQIWVHRDVGDFIIPWLWLYPRQIAVTSDEAPDPGSFWGYRFLIEQIRQYPETTGVPLADPVLRIPLVKMVASLHNFPASPQQKAYLQSWAAGHEPALQVRTIGGSDWRSYLAACDCQIIYLYCHGHTFVPRPGALDSLNAMERSLNQPPEDDDSPVVREYRSDLLSSIQELRKKHLIDQTHIRIDNEVLTMHDLRKFKVAAGSSSPLVFLNMCESAQIWPNLTEGLVDVFLRRGARGVLGTEMPIPSRFGDLFGRTFFDGFSEYHDLEKYPQDGEGRTIGEVLWMLRRRFLDAGNPLVFAYSYYGNAATRFRPALAGIKPRVLGAASQIQDADPWLSEGGG
jgi:hypothetical protein